MSGVPDESIRKLLYVTDDKVIADFLGVKSERVADVRTNRPPEKPMPTYSAPSDGGTFLGNEGAIRAAQIAACTDHLKALIRYGIKNDRDLGMGAERFYAVAAEHGIHVMARAA